MTTTATGGVYFQIPLRATPQSLGVVLLGVSYNLRTRWSRASNCWTISLYDVDNNLLVGEVPMVTGCDLLGQYAYLGIGGGLLVYDTSGPPDAVPGFASLGVTAQLLFFPYAVS